MLGISRKTMSEKLKRLCNVNVNVNVNVTATAAGART